MRGRGEAASTANVLSHPSAIRQPSCQAASLASGLGKVVAIGMGSNASSHK